MYLKIVKEIDVFYLYSDGNSICDVADFNLPENYSEEYFGTWFDVAIYILKVY